MPNTDPEKRQEYNQHYYSRNKEKLLANKKRNQQKNREVRLRHYYRNKEKVLAKAKTEYALNKDEVLAFQKRYYALNKDKIQTARKANPHNKKRERDAEMWRLYGITREYYDNLLAQQNYLCALCGRKGSPHKERPLVIDHCHETGVLRGLLCISCNTALGKLGDNETGLTRALEYVRANTTKG